MAVSLITCVLVFVTTSLCSVVVLSEENIPVIAWSNSKSLAGVHSFAQQPLYASISNIVYNNEKIILFAQEKMCFDDLAKYGGLYGGEGVLKNIKDYVSTSASSVMLSVPYQPNFATFLVEEFSFSFNVGKTEYFSAKDIMTDDTVFVNSNCKLCVISLPEASSSSTSDQASRLAESDKFISSVMGKDVVQQDKYIAMVTAKYSQMHSKQQPTLKRAARALSAKNCSIPFLHCTDNKTLLESNRTCYFLMRFDEIMIDDRSNYTYKIFNKNNTGATASPPSCSIEEFNTENVTYIRKITVTYTGVRKTDKVTNNITSNDSTIMIQYLLPFNNQSTLKLPVGFWTLELNIIIENSEPYLLTYKKEGIPPYPLTIPNGASFHCTNATYCRENSDGDLSRCNYTFPHVTIKGLQVELFKHANRTEFSIAYDCEPYFSAATWMGVFTLSILLPIVIVGFFLVFQTQTMDRFDDPREPALQTTVLD